MRRKSSQGGSMTAEDDPNPLIGSLKILAFPSDEAGEAAMSKQSSRKVAGLGAKRKLRAPLSCGEDSAGDDGLDGVIERLNDEFALILMGSRAIIMRESSAAPIADRIRILSIEAFKSYLENKGSVVSRKVRDVDGSWTLKQTYVKWAPQWIAHKRRRTYDGVEFFPDPTDAPGTPAYFNLWRGLSCTPDPAPANERRIKYKTFRDHLFTNMCNGDQAIFEWVFAWLAHIVQRPRERIGTAIVMRGKMGSGKTKIGEVVGSLFPSHYFLVDDPRYLVGNFNAHMASCLLLQVDEGFWAGDKAAEGRLKGLTTAPMQMIESKGIDPIRLKNYVRLLFSSNEDWVIPAGMDERRFCVLDIAPNCAQNHSYFAEMDAELNQGGREALLADLLALDLDAPDAPNLRTIPKTSALLEQKLRSLDSVSEWWFEWLCCVTLCQICRMPAPHSKPWLDSPFNGMLKLRTPILRCERITSNFSLALRSRHSLALLRRTPR
jgi:hypothetical protein